MIAVDLANAVFLICLVGAGILLLITLLLDDELAGVLHSLRLQRRTDAVPVLTYLFAFLAAFGLGGIVGTRILNAEPAPAAALGLVCGLIAIAVTLAAFALNERNRDRNRSKVDLDDFVGHRGRVTSFIKADGQGTVSVNRGDVTREFLATSNTDLAEGSLVVVRDLDEAGSALVVTPASHSIE